MISPPKQTVTAAHALDTLLAGQPLINKYVTGLVELTGLDEVDVPIDVENCIFEHFEAACCQFRQPVKLVNTEFKQCGFVFSYFLGGLEILNCVFDSYLDFQAGGHNQQGNPVRISHTTFRNFVNFFDCWYESEVMITHNDFQQGTNLLGKPFDIAVTFDVTPIIENNSGQINFDHEGNINEIQSIN